jgi:hypothetical protein
MDHDRIASCRITPHDLFTLPKVMVIMEGESDERFLFDFLPDEVSFTEEEFVGLTRSDALTLIIDRDKAFLWGP